MAKLTAALLVCFAALVGSAEAQQQDRLMMTRDLNVNVSAFLFTENVSTQRL